MMMERTYLQAIEHRRSYYALHPSSAVPDERISDVLRTALLHVPSAFNSQSARLVLLLGDHHRRLWEIVLHVLRSRIDADAYALSHEKVTRAFASGYGTVLFFEDDDVIRKLQTTHPPYADRFPVWSQQCSAMHQLTVWTMLEELGFGASLQHYDPLIDEGVREQWGIDPAWRLIAQMPFGTPAEGPGVKEFDPLPPRLLVFR